MSEQVQMYRKQLTAQQKEERQQDNVDKKRLARQHLSDLLRSLTCERDRLRTAWCQLDSTSSFASPSDQTFHVLCVRHMIACVHLVIFIHQVTFCTWT